jgi:hypothetical protein
MAHRRNNGAENARLRNPRAHPRRDTGASRSSDRRGSDPASVVLHRDSLAGRHVLADSGARPGLPPHGRRKYLADRSWHAQRPGCRSPWVERYDGARDPLEPWFSCLLQTSLPASTNLCPKAAERPPSPPRPEMSASPSASQIPPPPPVLPQKPAAAKAALPPAPPRRPAQRLD